MKVDKFVFEVLMTYWLPGAVAAAALAMLFGIRHEALAEFIAWAKDAEFLSSIAIVGILTLVGATVAAVENVIEEFALDRIVTPKSLKITTTVFKKEWDAYLWDLPNCANDYIDRLVLFFLLETRLGLAAALLAAGLFQHGWIPMTITGAFAFIFYGMGLLHHRELAAYRHKNYPGGLVPIR